MSERYDLIAVGAGPAALSVGLYGSRFGIRTLVLGETLGGLASEAVLVENYPGVQGRPGSEIVEVMKQQCEKAGADIILSERVNSINIEERTLKLQTGRETYEADAVVLATGCCHRKLGVPGEKELYGKGVSYCAVCDGMFFRGKRVAVIGGGNAAAMEALFLTEIADKVFMIHRRDSLRADGVMKKRVEESGIDVLWSRRLIEIEGDKKVDHLVLEDARSGENETLDVDGCFISIGESPETDFAGKAGIELDEKCFIVVNSKQETNIPGVYAAGDVTGGVCQIGVAVGEGISAATNAYLYITGGWYGANSD